MYYIQHNYLFETKTGRLSFFLITCINIQGKLQTSEVACNEILNCILCAQAKNVMYQQEDSWFYPDHKY